MVGVIFPFSVTRHQATILEAGRSENIQHKKTLIAYPKAPNRGIFVL
jgi:hypothetical protein